MQLKLLEIRHENYYSATAPAGNYVGKIEFFNQKGDTIGMNIKEEMMLEIAKLCADIIKQTTQEAAESIISSVNPLLQIEQQQTERIRL